MINLSLATVADVTSAKLLEADENIRFNGVCIDSRKLQAGQLFAALPGSRVNGHRYVKAVLDNAAAVALVSEQQTGAGPQLLVADVQIALGQLAAYWLKQLRDNLQVIAITGSNGKTTVKEMLAAVLGRQHRALVTQGNLNNELGLPLTLFELNQEHEYAVLELGASHPGDIAYLVEICQPDIALVNNVGPAHLQGFGDLPGVARSKGEIYQGLSPAGIAIINIDEPWQEIWQAQIGDRSVVTYSSAGKGDVSADLDAGNFSLKTPAGSINTLKLPLPGRHNRMNALAATAVLSALSIPLEEIKAGLENVKPVAARLHKQVANGGWKVIDDTYNANPASLRAGLAVLCQQLEGTQQAWLVLGDMAELGSTSAALHRQMGADASTSGVHRLFAIGEQTRFSVLGFGERAEHYTNKENLLAAVLQNIHPDVTCMVKGSRSMGMGSIARALLKQPAGNESRETLEPEIKKEAS